MSEFQPAVDYLLSNEGGKVSNPSDPGGKTNFGITQRVYEITDKGDVFDLTKEQSCEYYKRIWWLPDMENIRSQRVATKLFDHQVNMGRVTANRLMQAAAGLHTPYDGILGPWTVECINNRGDSYLLPDFVGILKAYYKSLEAKNPKLIVFDKGWMRRVERLP